MSEQQYAVDCSCGKEIPVTASMAGSNVACSCGAPVAVPRLSELRQRVGLAAYESGIIDTIHRMVNTGELPYGNECVISGMQTTDAFVLRVECERKWIKGAGKRRFLFLFLLPLLPFWLIWLAVAKTLADEPREELGRDTSVDVPLRVHCDFHAQLRKTKSQRELQRLLRTVPIYAKLLDEYPHAKIATV